jgi:HAD superfamily hydrolase (TIGR01484 family)
MDACLPWTDAPLDRLATVRGVFTDIDDTLTRDGAIEPAALAALADLRAAGRRVIALTARPMGWSQPFAAAWPVAAIVAENGAVALVREGGHVATIYAQDQAVREHNARRLQAMAERIVREVPGATLARDSAGRVTDIAIDHSEFAHLNTTQIAQVVALMHNAGMHATVSSIHINGWFGEHNKLTGAKWMVEHLFKRHLDTERSAWLYVGDSTNDQTMFAAFEWSVGVANLQTFAAQLHTWPRYLTERERGHGFAEVANALLRAREASPLADKPRPGTK